MFYILSIFWFIRTTKIILFYLYLWQLKEYHVGRFLSHFRTDKGKRLLLSEFVLAKIIILFPFLWLLFTQRYLGKEFFLSAILGALSFLYFIEVFFVFKNIFQKNFKKPVLTKKAAFLIAAGLLIEILVLFVVINVTDIYFFLFWLLLADILFPLIICLIVLFLQPFVVLYRDEFILKKAKIERTKYKKLKVIGITGSYGKTSTKEFLSTILSEKFRVLKTQKHQNSEVGISQCILKELKWNHQVFIVEMGAYGQRGIKLLSDIVKPQIGILTGINEQHLVLFGSQDKIIKTKYELIENLPKDGLAIFNGDNKYCLELYKKTNMSKKLYKTEKSDLGLDIWAEDIKTEKENILFKIFTKDGKSANFKINVLGAQNVLNISAAILTAKELGMDLEEISQACSKIKPEQGTMKLFKKRDDPFIIDSTYSANSDGVIADLDYLKIWPLKKAIIMPCLIELGKSSKEIHKKIGKKIGKVCDLAIITTKERFEEIKQGAIEAGMPEESILYIEKPEEIINQISIFSSPGDVVLLEGRVPKEVSKFVS